MKTQKKHPIDRISIMGYKSFRELSNFELRNLNVLIGANGSGKSNFISFFRLLRELIEQRLQFAINKAGGADMHLFLGPQETNHIIIQLKFGTSTYEVWLAPTNDNRFVFANEQWEDSEPTKPFTDLGRGQWESRLKDRFAEGEEGPNLVRHRQIYHSISSWTAYHVHDTSETAGMRREGSANDNEFLRDDAGNLAAYLLSLQENDRVAYGRIRDTVRLAAPFFDDFLFRPKSANGDQKVKLEWRQTNSDYPFQPSQLSDGTLRFICLATALLQHDPPATILLDEPELGLHPQALDILAELVKGTSKRCQVIVSTQSVTLLNAFEPEEVIVVDREQGESRMRRLSRKELDVWLEQEYTLGDIWHKNIIGGGPVHE